MYSSESLYNAIINDDINQLTNGSIADYGFHTTSESNLTYLFGSYQAISKFMTREKFIETMHNAYLNKNLHETVNNLTDKIPTMFRVHWNDFISNGGKIAPIYL